jgi:hypothetical protein
VVKDDGGSKTQLQEKFCKPNNCTSGNTVAFPTRTLCAVWPYQRERIQERGQVKDWLIQNVVQFVTFDAKYPKFQKNIKKMLNKSYSRESRTNFPGMRD